MQRARPVRRRGPARDRRGGRSLEGGGREGDRGLPRVAGAGDRARARRRGDQGRLRIDEGGRQGRRRPRLRRPEAPDPRVGRRTVLADRREGRRRRVPRARRDRRRQPRRAHDRDRQARNLGRRRHDHARRRRAPREPPGRDVDLHAHRRVGSPRRRPRPGHGGIATRTIWQAALQRAHPPRRDPREPRWQGQPLRAPRRRRRAPPRRSGTAEDASVRRREGVRSGRELLAGGIVRGDRPSQRARRRIEGRLAPPRGSRVRARADRDHASARAGAPKY